MFFTVSLPVSGLCTRWVKPVVMAFTCLLLLPACNQNQAATEVKSNTETETRAAAGVKSIDSKEAKALLQQQPQVVVLDVRTAGEFTGGHLENALNLDFKAPEFADQLTRLDKTKPYMLYCAVGGRSGKAASLMHEMGFAHVYTVSEGYPQLKEAGLAVQ